MQNSFCNTAEGALVEATPARVVDNRFCIMALLRLILGVPSICIVSVYSPHQTLVRQLFNGMAGEGAHSFVWDGKDFMGREAPQGTYIVRAEVNGSPVTEHSIDLVR